MGRISLRQANFIVTGEKGKKTNGVDISNVGGGQLSGEVLI